MEALGHFHYHFWKLERLSYLKCFHRFFTESSQCDLKSQILKHDARFSFCIFWTFYKKKKNRTTIILSCSDSMTYSNASYVCIFVCVTKIPFLSTFLTGWKELHANVAPTTQNTGASGFSIKPWKKNGTVSKTAEGMSVYTKKTFNTRREENNLLNIQENPLSANNQQPHNNKIQLRVERVTANPPSPSWPEQPPEAPRCACN